MSRKELILATVSDMAARLLYYDRKEDAELPVGAIEKSILADEITISEIVAVFRRELEDSI